MSTLDTGEKQHDGKPGSGLITSGGTGPSVELCSTTGPDEIRRVVNLRNLYGDPAKGVEPGLYRLPEVIAAASVIFAGCKMDADVLAGLGFAATACSMGDNQWKDSYSNVFSGKDIVFIPINSDAGRRHALSVSKSLYRKARSVKILPLPDLPENGGVRDFIKRFSDPVDAAESLSVMADGATIWEPGTKKSEEKKQPHFKLVHVGELEVKPPVFLVKNLLEADSFTLLFGDPGSFKSFLALALACCVATGTSFGGRQVKHGPVCYIAGEGFSGLARRFKGWAIRNQVSLKDAPIFVSTMPAGLCDTEQTQHVLAAIAGIAEKHGPPVLIVIDTVARSFGPGDENSTRDMSGFIVSCDVIRSRYQATVLLVHHSGHGDKTRARGAMALKGALDSEYRVSIDDSGVIRLDSQKMKDAPPPSPMAFRASVVDLGLFDEDGHPVTSVVLDEIDYSPPLISEKKTLGRWQTVAVKCLEKLEAAHRKRLTDGGFDPCSCRVTVEDLHSACKASGMSRETWRSIKTNPPARISIQNEFCCLTDDA